MFVLFTRKKVSIILKVLTKETLCSLSNESLALRETQDPLIFTQMWLGVCEEVHFGSTESTRFVSSLRVSLLLSFTVFYPSAQKNDNTRHAVPRSQVCDGTQLEQIRLQK